MRISVEKDDPGFWPASELLDVTVSGDGVRQTCTYTADDEAGVAVVADLEAGVFVVDVSHPDTMARKTLRGAVVITMPNDLRRRIETARAKGDAS
jgi:hypothetical protein